MTGAGGAPEAGPRPAAAPAAAGWTADLGKPTRLVLLRHGVTPLTGEKRFSGLGDPQLTAAGLAQARAAARRLASAGYAFGPVEAVVHSPLTRTRQTAEASAELLGLTAEPEPGLRELDFGRLEGLSFAEARDEFPDELTAFLGSPAVPAPGGESVEQTAARAAAARDRLLERHPRRTVLAVTHVTPIKALACLALGAPLEAVHRMELGPASITVIDYYADGVANLRCLNDIAHLAADQP